MATEAGKSGGSGQPDKQEKKGTNGPSPGSTDRRRLLRWGVVALAILVGVVAWVATQGDDGDSGEPESDPVGFEAKIVDEAELIEIAGSAGHEVYWAGPISGKELEASETGGGIQVRYVDEGADPEGDPAATLTIGSYPLPDAAGALQGFAEREGSIVRESDQVGQVVSSTEAPSSVYFASPDGSLQIEVYDPSPARAMNLARSGEVQPVG